ncbi:hypothetical protein BDV29DRAFT_139318 [Aspergillus leporis]|uniref:Uncharacterized protein n=1 Tax=Aspergillus leporis TaxID=41062 RepID=A0A5N5WXN6_9EURO|nr:hypothetical protein BDV29DRAFT_139318 [Aspergillus leporis]
MGSRGPSRFRARTRVRLAGSAVVRLRIKVGVGCVRCGLSLVASWRFNLACQDLVLNFSMQSESLSSWDRRGHSHGHQFSLSRSDGGSTRSHPLGISITCFTFHTHEVGRLVEEDSATQYRYQRLSNSNYPDSL